MTNASTRLVLAALALGLLVGAAGRAEAGIIININEVGSDVVTTVSGSIDLTGLTDRSPVNQPAVVRPIDAVIFVGPLQSGEGFAIPADALLGATGPSSFGSGLTTFPSSGSGDFVGVLSPGGMAQIDVPRNYVSGTMLSATDKYSGTTLSDLGLTPGTYTYHWGTGGDSHTLTVQIGAVPEPSSLALALTGGALALGYAWRRHRRARPCSRVGWSETPPIP